MQRKDPTPQGIDFCFLEDMLLGYLKLKGFHFAESGWTLPHVRS